MVIRCRIEPADFQALLESVTSGGSPRAGEGFARPFWRNLGIWFVIGLAGTLFVNFMRLGSPPAWFWPAVIGFLSAAIGSAALLAVLHFRARRRAVPRSDGSILGEHVLDFSQEGVTETCSHHKNESRWSGIIEIRIARNHVFLMTDSCAGYIVPKRAFANPEEERSFLDAIDRFRAGESRVDA